MPSRLLSTLTFILLIPAILSTPLLEKRAFQYEQCSESQKALIESYLEDMRALATAGAIHSEPTRLGPEHAAWFGLEPPSNQPGRVTNEKINTRYEKLSALRTTSSVTISCNTDASCCTKGRFGPVPACGDRPGDAYIRLCSGFWTLGEEYLRNLAPRTRKDRLSLDKYRTRAYTLLHELFHSRFSSLDIKFAVKDQFGRSQDYVGYGHENILILAQHNATQARLNADTYAYFAMASYFGGPSMWATYPNEVDGP